jgi:uncharacterized damage-inducible protein DinB
MRMSPIVALVLILRAVPAEAQITDLERQRLLAHLQMTAGWLADEVSALSTEQLHFRPSANAWTILEVLDHLVVVGQVYWNDLQGAKPVTSGRAGMMSDVDVLWYGVDRTNRETALRTEEPSRKLRDVATGVADYRRQHTRLLEYVRTTRDDLRRRFVERQNSDAYQWALLISTHDQRHILQVREIKSHAKFPKR